eukprot:scaffold1344_cov102-Cylindrotheca_fusiformis.AAC.4
MGKENGSRSAVAAGLQNIIKSVCPIGSCPVLVPSCIHADRRFEQKDYRSLETRFITTKDFDTPGARGQRT